ncbi:MAG: hypothetical protein ACREUU_11970, partial [Gammaproteobacteria bacterium]
MAGNTTAQRAARIWAGIWPVRSTSVVGRHQVALMAVAFSLLTFAVYWYLGPKDTPYINHIYQADAFLHGRLDLGQDYPWLELAFKDGKVYEVHPPVPSI